MLTLSRHSVWSIGLTHSEKYKCAVEDIKTISEHVAGPVSCWDTTTFHYVLS